MIQFAPMKKMTDCAAWASLRTHCHALRQTSLRQLVANTPNRFQQFSAEAANLFFDYSKNYITSETIDLLCALALERELPKAIRDLFSGEKINYSENRPALHMALRMPENQTVTLDGENIIASIQTEFKKIEHIAQSLQQKKLLGCNGKPIDTILHVGMGGSDLGPALFYQAFAHQPKHATCYFLSEFDHIAIQNTLSRCNPETTIAVIVSKSFTTPETFTVFETIRHWFHAAFPGQPIFQHFYAVTANQNCALEKNFLLNHIFKIGNWVGGRYSIWSAVSFSVILTFGMENFKRFLHGAHQMDLHFQKQPLQKNIPMIMALLSIWYHHFFDSHTQAIIPYHPRLKLLTTYLQQLHMESLGKSVTWHGEKIDYATGKIIWGDVGPNSQHSFHQLLMQGTQMIPVDFILPLCDSEWNEYDMKRVAYCLSQSEILLQGFADTQAHQRIEGNRPSTTIIMNRLTPELLGALIACYEHSVFVQSVILGINAFDQWGVERGKQIADKMIAAMIKNISVPEFDNTTRGLLEKIFQSVTV